MKLPDNFEKEYFSLLTPIVTDGTVKNRRNLLVATFSISILYFLEKPLSSLNIFGIKLESTDGKTILIAALVLISFWLFMFCIHATKDMKINKERHHLLNRYVDRLEETLKRYKDVLEAKKNDPDFNATKIKVDIINVERQCQTFNEQKGRTTAAKKLAILAFTIEYSLPLLLWGWCVIKILKDLCVL